VSEAPARAREPVRRWHGQVPSKARSEHSRSARPSAVGERGVAAGRPAQ